MITWIGVGLVYPKASQARSNGLERWRSMKEFAWKETPSALAKNDLLSPPAAEVGISSSSSGLKSS